MYFIISNFIQDGSWAIDEEEDEQLRQLYPNAKGHLYEVSLNKGQGSLGKFIDKRSNEWMDG